MYKLTQSKKKTRRYWHKTHTHTRGQAKRVSHGLYGLEVFSLLSSFPSLSFSLFTGFPKTEYWQWRTCLFFFYYWGNHYGRHYIKRARTQGAIGKFSLNNMSR